MSLLYTPEASLWAKLYECQLKKLCARSPLSTTVESSYFDEPQHGRFKDQYTIRYTIIVLLGDSFTAIRMNLAAGVVRLLQNIYDNASVLFQIVIVLSIRALSFTCYSLPPEGIACPKTRRNTHALLGWASSGKYSYRLWSDYALLRPILLSNKRSESTDCWLPSQLWLNKTRCTC